jgi:hypothetical protein
MDRGGEGAEEEEDRWPLVPLVAGVIVVERLWSC